MLSYIKTASEAVLFHTKGAESRFPVFFQIYLIQFILFSLFYLELFYGEGAVIFAAIDA